MNNRIRQSYEGAAAATGLQLDEAGGVVYGNRGGYEMILYPANANYPYMLTIEVSVQRQAGPLTKDEAKSLRRAAKPIASAVQNERVVRVQLKNQANPRKFAENVAAAVTALETFLHEQGFFNVCRACGKPGPAVSCIVSGAPMHLCEDCYRQIEQNKALEQAHKEQKKDNVAAGAVGAFAGSLAGVVCIILLSRLGYVAALSGVIMAVCALKGYELLGGKLTKKGIVISIAVMVVMTYLGDRADWAIVAMSGLGLDFFNAFRLIPDFLSEGMIDAGSYWGNLALLYVFVLLGAVPTVMNAVRAKRSENLTFRLGSGAVTR